MGCIQSYFRKAATGSSQASPTDIVKHIIEQEHHSKSTSEVSKVAIVSQDEPSAEQAEIGDADSENDDQHSLHCVEATAVRTLAASTGTVAILGTTAKCNETVDYRRSVYSEQAYAIDFNFGTSTPRIEYEEAAEKQLGQDVDVATPSDTTESANITITAIIEAPPSMSQIDDAITKIEAKPEVEQQNHTPNVMHSNQKLSSTMDGTDEEGIIAPEYAILKDTEESSDGNKTSENSERESSSSEVVSVVKEARESVSFKFSRPTSFDSSRLNRLSLGQQSVESDQNTVEISSADDVKNESTTELTSPESLKCSLDESLIKSVASKINAKEISNTSLNTLGNDSEEDGSDLETDSAPRKSAVPMKHFDTISSNGETSCRIEEYNCPSAIEVSELEEEYASQLELILRPTAEQVFETEERNRYVESVRETVTCEMDKICEEAIERTTDILMADNAAEESKEGEDTNNVSESSVMSAIDSAVAEKGSDFDSLSFLDEQSDSRSISVHVLGEDARSCRSETIHEQPPHRDAQKRLQEADLSPTLVCENTFVSMQDISGAVIMQEDHHSVIDNEKTLTESISEDLPRPPDLEDLPPLPEYLELYDITEEELKAVQLPEDRTRAIDEDTSLQTAASKIQAGVRGYLTRKQIKSLKSKRTAEMTSDPAREKLDTFDMECSKNFSKNKRLSLDSKLVDIENIRKLPKLKSTLSECIEEESETLSPDLDKAATKIQNTYRDYRARKSICLGDRNITDIIINGKSIKMENLFSNNNAYQKYNPSLTDAVTEKQSENNDSKAEETTKTKLFENDSLQPLIEGIERNSNNSTDVDNSVEKAAMKIQAKYRGFKARKSLQISASAATKIQAYFRGYKVRKVFERCNSLNDLRRNSTSSSCSNISNQQDLDKHVTKIQAGVRGYLVRKRHSIQNLAAARIQINYRKYKSKKLLQTKPLDE